MDYDAWKGGWYEIDDEFRNDEYLKHKSLPDQEEVESCIEAAAHFLLEELDTKKASTFIKRLCFLYDIDTPGEEND